MKKQDEHNSQLEARILELETVVKAEDIAHCERLEMAHCLKQMEFMLRQIRYIVKEVFVNY